MQPSFLRLSLFKSPLYLYCPSLELRLGGSVKWPVNKTNISFDLSSGSMQGGSKPARPGAIKSRLQDSKKCIIIYFFSLKGKIPVNAIDLSMVLYIFDAFVMVLFGRRFRGGLGNEAIFMKLLPATR